MLITKTVTVKWNPTTRPRYESFGYKFTKYNDEFVISVDCLSDKSHQPVDVMCDYCGKIISKQWHKYLSQHDDESGDSCIECKGKKFEATCYNKYGVSHPMKVEAIRDKANTTCLERYGVKVPSMADEFKAKSKETCIDRYGVDNYAKTSECIDKIKATCNEKYGVDYFTQTDEFIDKSKATCMNKYGVEYFSQTEEAREASRERIYNSGIIGIPISEDTRDKMKATCKERYGVEYPLQSKDIRNKAWVSMIESGNTPTSKPEREVCELLIDIYGDANCAPSKPFDYYVLDCELIVDGSKIDVEYDGWTHRNIDEVIKKDKIRDGYMKHNGYKILRISGNYNVPTKEQIKEAVDYLVKGNHSHTEIILDI